VVALTRLLDSLRWLPADWIVAFATIALVATGIIQWRALLQQAKTAEKAADAAKESANILIASERPHGVIQNLTIRPPWASSLDKMIYLVLDYQVVNYGRTPAWPTKVQIRKRVHESSQLENAGGPQYVEQSDTLAGILVPRQTKDFEYSHPSLLAMTQDEFDSTMGLTAKKNLFIYGFIEYQDLRKKSYHRTCAGCRIVRLEGVEQI